MVEMCILTIDFIILRPSTRYYNYILNDDLQEKGSNILVENRMHVLFGNYFRYSMIL